MIDKYLNINLIFDIGTNAMHRGTVVKRSRVIYGRAFGRLHTNPSVDTREYEISFTDGTWDNYAVNIFADNLYV